MHFLCAFFISVLISRDKTVINCINERDGLSYLLTSKPLLRLQSGLCNQKGHIHEVGIVGITETGGDVKANKVESDTTDTTAALRHRTVCTLAVQLCIRNKE